MRARLRDAAARSIVCGWCAAPFTYRGASCPSRPANGSTVLVRVRGLTVAGISSKARAVACGAVELRALCSAGYREAAGALACEEGSSARPVLQRRLRERHQIRKTHPRLMRHDVRKIR